VRFIRYKCAHCGKPAAQPVGAVNRARKIGAKLFCGRKCSGLSHRKNKSKARKRQEKKLYDAAYRRKNRELLKAKKAEYFKRTYNPEAARIERKKRAKAHAEYCRRPEYRKWKREYDRRYRAAEYGPFAEAYMLVIDLNREVKTRMSNYEIRKANKTGNKRQERARDETGKGHRNDHRTVDRQFIA
jgi:hypothetical protein